MNEPRHNTNLIVTVLSACVALMCGVPAAAGAQAKSGVTPLPVSYADVLKENNEFELPQAEATAEKTSRITRLSRFGNFRASTFLRLLDLSAVLPRVDTFQERATLLPNFHPIGENTASLGAKQHFLTISNLPRAGIA
jgi:hypothetical protein